jgi:hypothetical protein
MYTRRLLFCALLLISGALFADDAKERQLEAVLVTGEVPGPSLWKVSRGDHTMWVLGTVQPLPKKLRWRSAQVEAIIAGSQEVITPGRALFDLDIGFIETARSIGPILRLQRNPNDAKLVDVLEPDVYAVWWRLKLKYIGRSKYTDRLRPMFAIEKLQSAALEESGLDPDGIVWPIVRKSARKYDVKVTSPDLEVEVKIERASDVVKDIEGLPIDDRDCFKRTVEQLEGDLENKRLRANAWAVGDIEALRLLNQEPQTPSCGQMLRQAMLGHESALEKADARRFVELARTENERAREEVRRRWIAAVEASLESNHSTFAFLPMYDLVNPHGRLQLLREKGYIVEPPAQ